MTENGGRPLVSVVLPTRNRPERLVRALRSVLAQSYTNLEVLIVDDASTVPVAEAVEGVAIGDSRVRQFRLATNSGAAAARNEAFAQARGGVIAFIDDDDLWKPDKLARQVDYLSRHPDVGIVTSDFEIVAERRPDQVVTNTCCGSAFRGAFPSTSSVGTRSETSSGSMSRSRASRTGTCGFAVPAALRSGS
jgi:glycosyltransferase involved in cell wall biosynthesis